MSYKCMITYTYERKEKNMKEKMFIGVYSRLLSSSMITTVCSVAQNYVKL